MEDVSGRVHHRPRGSTSSHAPDIVGYYRDNPDIDRLPSGINAVVGDEPGVIFVLRNVNQQDRPRRRRLHPFYVVRMG